MPIDQAAIGGDVETDRSAGEGLVDEQSLAVGVEGALVGIAESVGDDPCSSAVHQHDESVGDIAAICQGTWVMPCADGDPKPSLTVAQDEIRRWDRRAVDFGHDRRYRAAWFQAPDAAITVPQMGKQETAARLEGDSVGAQDRTAVFDRDPSDGAIRLDDRHATPATPIGHEDAAGFMAEHAFRPVQPVAQEFHGLYAFARRRRRRFDLLRPFRFRHMPTMTHTLLRSLCRPAGQGKSLRVRPPPLTQVNGDVRRGS